MLLTRMSITNRSRDDLLHLHVEDVEPRPAELEASIWGHPRILVRSPRHGTKRLSIGGQPRTGRWRVTAHMGRGRCPVSAVLDPQGARLGGQLRLEGQGDLPYRMQLWRLGDEIVLVIEDEPDPISWMHDLSDDTPLSAISMPGTHDSCARFGGAGYECQTQTIGDQLLAGVRFLDIRCRHFENGFPIHHGAVYQHQDFGVDVQDVCLSFLQQHPHETIVMSIKSEHTPSDNTETFQQTFERYIAPNRAFWYLDDRTPSLGEARGRIVLLRRFDADTTPFGVAATPWLDDDTFAIVNRALLKVQDEYVVPTLCNIDDKWDRVKAMIEDASAGRRDVWYVNFCSGAQTAPIDVAMGSPGIRGVNEFLLDYLITHPTGRVGILGLDFPEQPEGALVGEIIARNVG